MITTEVSYLFIVIFTILIIASLIGNILKQKYGIQNKTISNLTARINAWWIMILILLFAFLFGKVGTTILFFLISFIALREFMTLVYRRQSDYYSMVTCFYLLLPIQYYFVIDH